MMKKNINNKVILGLFFLLGLMKFQAQENTQITIDEAVELALQNNANVKKAALDVQAANQKVWETIAIGLPQISGQFGYNYFLNAQEQPMPDFFYGTDNLLFLDSPVKQNISASATLSQLLFNGSYLVGLQSVKVYKLISELAKDKTDIAIKEAVHFAYTGVIVLDENLKTLEENRKISDKNLHDISEIYKVGLGEEQSVEQMQYNHSSLLVAINNAQQTRKTLLNSLKHLIGKPLSENLKLTTSLEKIIEKSSILQDENADLTNHIDLKLAENEVKSYELQLKNEKSKALPTVAAFLSGSINSYDKEFKLNDLIWHGTTIVGLSVELPIFSSFARKSRVEQAKINLEKALINKSETEINLQQQAQAKTIEYQNALATYNNTKELIRLSERIFNKQQTKFYEGIGSSFDLSQAERQKYDAQNQYIQAAFNLVQTKIALDKAIGKL